MRVQQASSTIIKKMAEIYILRNRFFTLSALAFTLSCANAQTSRLDSLHIFNDQRIIDVFSQTQNPAVLSNFPLPEHGYAQAGASMINGDFKRPMDAESMAQLQMSTGGFKRYKGWSYKSMFSYQKQFDVNTAWSGVMNAYEGNPFIWVDSSAGDWERDHISATINVATPVIFNKMNAGFSVDYNIGTGARSTDPKPFYRSRHIAMQPGIEWQSSAKSSLGMTGKISFIQEENELGFYSSNNVLLYRLRGFGTFSKVPFVSGERKRNGTEVKGLLHYRRQYARHQLSINGYASQKYESVTEGVAILQNTGYFTEIHFGGSADIQKGDAQRGQSLSLGYELIEGYADDVIFRAESAGYTTHRMTGDISMWNTGADKKRIWQLTFSPSFSLMDISDLATRTQLTVTTLGVECQVNWRKTVSRNAQLQIRPVIGYHKPLQKELGIQNANVITKNLIEPDFAFFSTSYAQIGSLIMIDIGKPGDKFAHILKVQGEKLLVADYSPFNGRNRFHIGYTIIFR
jgi:hypothetical protein